MKNTTEEVDWAAAKARQEEARAHVRAINEQIDKLDALREQWRRHGWDANNPRPNCRCKLCRALGTTQAGA